jgi:hypothetical protein
MYARKATQIRVQLFHFNVNISRNVFKIVNFRRASCCTGPQLPLLDSLRLLPLTSAYTVEAATTGWQRTISKDTIITTTIIITTTPLAAGDTMGDTGLLLDTRDVE